MKKSILIFIFLITAGTIFAQEPTVFAKLRCTKVADKQLPVDSVERISFTEKKLRRGKFKFSYHNASDDADVNRSFSIQDKSGKEVYNTQGSSFRLKAKELRRRLDEGPLTIFSMAIPSDPEKAKIVRVRPIVVAVISLTR